ncbi:hypothetical protein ACUH9Y_07075 [Dermabacteraceae bacterium P13115]|nr:hypothetical protein [Dermabacteraceae bacterium TAE3-ERU5]
MFQGMNPQQGREVAQQLLGQAGEVERWSEEIKASLASLDWVGPDADAYRSEATAVISGMLSPYAQAIRERAGKLTEHVEEQERASQS